MSKPTLSQLLKTKHSFIMAPMFLVSNVEMVKAAMQKGIAGCIPALNYRSLNDLEQAIVEMKKHKVEGGAFGINLIVNKSNPLYKDQLGVCCNLGVDFIITSLGNPKQVIEEAHKKGILVFCDVVDLHFAQKVEGLGCDALIAVNNEAGGHRGPMGAEELIRLLDQHTNLPVISAGGVADLSDFEKMISWGAAGVSVGSPFIASEEATVSEAYKEACVSYGAKDIVVTKRISGTACTVINTPYVKEIGTEETWVEKMLNKNKKLKKWVKMLRFMIGTNAVTKAATKATYKTLWVAGPSIEKTKKIEPVVKIIARFLPN